MGTEPRIPSTWAFLSHDSFPVRDWVNMRSSPIYNCWDLCLSLSHFYRSRNMLSFLLFCPYLNHSSDKTEHPILKSNIFMEVVPCQGSDSCLTGPLPCAVLILVDFRHKSSQRPFLSLYRIRALLLQLQCIWKSSLLPFRPRQPLNGGCSRRSSCFISFLWCRRVVPHMIPAEDEDGGIIALWPLFLAEQRFGGVLIPKPRQKHRDGNVQSFMLFLNPAITQMRSVRTNFILKCLVQTDWHVGSTKEVFSGFVTLWHGFVSWCLSMTRLNPSSYPCCQGPSEVVLQPMCAWLIKGNGPHTANICLWGEGLRAGTKNSSPS